MSEASEYLRIADSGIFTGDIPVNFKYAVSNPIHKEGGLYLPGELAPIDISEFVGLDYKDVCFNVIRPYISEAELSDNDLRRVFEKMDFEPDLKNYPDIDALQDNIYSLGLFGGPTEAFKDFGMIFNVGVINMLSATAGKISTFLSSTSGDTGAASQYMASLYHHVRSIITYPDGRVTAYQMAQIERAGDNLFAMGIKGTDFDGCTRLVNSVFNDPEFEYLNLVAANSKSIARIFGQMAYYVYSMAKLSENSAIKDAEFFVPSGNYGNATAAIWAMNAIREGTKDPNMPKIRKVHMVSNENDVVPRLYISGKYEPIDRAIKTPANAMDIHDPSNILRILATYDTHITEDGLVVAEKNGWQRLQEDTTAQAISNKEIETTMRYWHDNHGEILCPHSAVAAAGMKKIIDKDGFDHNTAYVFIKTASPVKFRDVVNGALDEEIIEEPEVDWAVQKPSCIIPYDEEVFKQLLRERVPRQN